MKQILPIDVANIKELLMINGFDEPVTLNDLLFACFIIERISRRIHRSNLYVVTNIKTEGITYLLEFATTLHSQNFNQTCDEMILEYKLKNGKIVKPEKPSDLLIGNVYSELIWKVQQEDLVQTVIDVYNSPICKVIDNYKTLAYLDPTPVLVNAYYNKRY